MTLEAFLKLVIFGVSAYVLIIFILRVSGKRTLSKMNAFDFIVTVALGSVLASTLVNHKTVFWEGITSFTLLVFLQFLTSWLSVHSKVINSLLKSQPKLLYYGGKFHRENMKKERVSENEILQALRSQGTEALESVSAVVLETDGTLSILKKQDKYGADALENVEK